MLPMLEQDKANHFVYGAVITKATALVLSFAGVDPQTASNAGFLVCVGAAATKELIHDKLLKRGTCDAGDFFATVFGGIVVTM